MFFTLFLTTIVLLCFYTKIKYFTRPGPIRGSPPYFLLGNLPEFDQLFIGLAVPRTLLRFRKRFGDIFQFWLQPKHVIVIGNINDVQHIFRNRHIYDQGALFTEKSSLIVPNALVSAKGAKLKQHGVVTIPLFRRAKIVSDFDLIIDSTDKLLDKWRTQPKDQIHTDIVQQS